MTGKQDEAKALFEAILTLFQGKKREDAYNAMAATVAFLSDEYGMPLTDFMATVQAWKDAAPTEAGEGLDS